MKKIFFTALVAFSFAVLSGCKSPAKVAEDMNHSADSLQKIAKEKNKNIKYVTGDRVRIRTKPNGNATVVAWALLNQIVHWTEATTEKEKIGDMEDYWYKLENSGNAEHWIYGSFLSDKPMTGGEIEDKFPEPLNPPDLFSKLIGTHWKDSSPTETAGRGLQTIHCGNIFFEVQSESNWIRYYPARIKKTKSNQLNLLTKVMQQSAFLKDPVKEEIIDIKWEGGKDSIQIRIQPNPDFSWYYWDKERQQSATVWVITEP